MDGTLRMLAVIKLPAKVSEFIEYVDLVITKMASSAYFTNPAPTPTLASVQTANNTLKVAQVAARGGGVGTVAARDADHRVVTLLMQELRGFVQSTADANVAVAASVIESAGMFVRKSPTRTKVDFAVTEGAVTGSALARVKSQGPGATYWWAFSSDQKTWTTAPVTRTAQTTISGLTAGTTYYFRYQVLTSEGLGDWSQIVSYMAR
jgi:hypothetical protein